MTNQGPSADRGTARPIPSANASSYRLAFEVSPFGILFHDGSGAIGEANPAAERMLGLSRAQLIGRDSIHTQWQCIHADGSPFPGREHPALEALRTGKVVENVVIGVLNPVLGGTCWLQVSAHPLGNAGQDQPWAVMTTFQDITAGRQAEARAQEARVCSEAVLASVMDPLLVTDAAGRFVAFNEAWAAYCRAGSSKPCPNTFQECHSLYEALQPNGDPLPEDQRIIPRALRGERGTNVQLMFRDQETGANWTGNYSFGPIRDAGGAIIGSVLTVRDITEQKRAAALLQEKEMILRLFVEFSPAAIAMLDTDMNYLAASRRWVEAFRLPQMDVVGMNHFDLLPDRPGRWAAIHQRCLAGAVERCDEDLLRRPDGTTDWIKWEIRPWRNGDGGIGGLVIFAEVITERKQAHDALRHLHAMLARTEQAVHLGSWEWEADTGRETWSPETFRILGRDPAQGVLPFAAQTGLYAPEDRARLLQAVGEALAKGFPFELELQVVRPDGEVRVCVVRGVPEWRADGKAQCIHGSLQDITERKRVETALRESEGKLRTLAARLHKAQEDERLRVSREIHDDLGQLLTALKMQVGGLERKLGGLDLPLALHPLIDQVVHVAELTDGLLDTVRRIATGLRPTLIDQLGLEDALRLELRRLQEHSGLSCAMVPGGPFPELDPRHRTDLFHICREALTNVLRHARAARVELGWRQDGDEAVFTVVDDGIGMGEVDGTATPAVGLTGMRERAALCGGRLQFELNPPHGTKVTVRLPWAGAAAAGGLGG